jgi:signal transduction histidine kinase
MFATTTRLGHQRRSAGLRRTRLLLAIIAQAAAGAAQAQGLPGIGYLDGALAANFLLPIAGVLIGGVLVWALLSIRRLMRRDTKLQRRVVELEASLNEAEAALSAEPHLLFIWRGRSALPDRIVGAMRGSARVPTDHKTMADFGVWLEPESALAIGSAIAKLKDEGVAFNLGIKTLGGELLEADGRAAGGLATLRLRALAGERRHITEMAYDVRKLARQVERLSAMLDSAPFPVWLRDTGGQLAWANRAYLEAVELDDVDAVIGRKIELVEPSKIEFDKPPIGNGETRIGRAHAVIAGAKRALDIHEAGLSEGLAGFAVDATALEESQRELRRHIRAHASTLDKLQTAIAIFGPDQRLRFFNAAYVELWGLDAAWLEGKPSDGEILDRLRSLRRLPEQANYRDWRANQLKAYTTLDTSETSWHLPDGQSLRVVCEQHPFGGVTYLYENVTEKLRLESQYNALIGVQRETLDNLHEGLALFGTDGRLRLYNPTFARMWGLAPEFLDEHPHVDRVIERAKSLFGEEAMWEELKYAVTSFDTAREPLNERIARRDGMVLQAATVPLPDGNTLLTYADVTATTRMQNALRERAEALEAADRLKTNFLSNVSYELRTPLTNIIGFSESLSIGIAGELQSKQHEYLRHIQTSSNDLLAIIDAILDLTTIDAGAMELKLARVPVTELLREAAESMVETCAKKGLTLAIEVADNANELVGDDKRIRQVITNLLSNAIGFSLPGGEVRMGAKRDGEDILLWVSDTGRGMEPEFQSRAFDRFQSQPAAGGHRGPGLGLAIVKSFVELHGGRVALLSRINKGTTVICRFPIRGPGAAGKALDANEAAQARIRQAS